MIKQIEWRSWLKLLMLGLAWVLVSTLSYADQKISRSFNIASGGTLELETDRGSIEVKTHSKAQVLVNVEIKGLDEDEFEVSFEVSDDQVQILGENLKAQGLGWGSKRVNFSITVPEAFDLDIRTSGGKIEVRDLAGEIDANTSGGSLKFTAIEGNLNAHTSGGPIRLSDIQGNADIDTSGGPIFAKDVFGDLTARTSGGPIKMMSVSGIINVKTSGGSISGTSIAGQISAMTSGGGIDMEIAGQLGGHSRLVTRGGSIDVFLSEQAAVTLNARGSRIKSDFTVNGQSGAKRALEGPINGGGPKLEVQANSGNINIRKL